MDLAPRPAAKNGPTADAAKLSRGRICGPAVSPADSQRADQLAATAILPVGTQERAAAHNNAVRSHGVSTTSLTRSTAPR
jgi:hypothetical protein